MQKGFNDKHKSEWRIQFLKNEMFYVGDEIGQLTEG